jgi:hypothetical protein
MNSSLVLLGILLFIIYTLVLRYENEIGRDTLKRAFDATCKERSTTDLRTRGEHIFEIVMHDKELQSLRNAYQKKCIYARDILFEAAMKKAIELYEIIR